MQKCMTGQSAKRHVVGELKQNTIWIDNVLSLDGCEPLQPPLSRCRVDRLTEGHFEQEIAPMCALGIKFRKQIACFDNVSHVMHEEIHHPL